MLKRTKAANKAAIEDAVDNENTAVTLGGKIANHCGIGIRCF